MECNRDEAIRAKGIAEKKFEAKDIAGAKKFAIKAQTLFPALEGIHQMLTTLDVYLNAENRRNGEADWYGILGVAHPSDDETIRRQYRKLALILHPDKNKSVGAEGAFKFVSAAWSVLSDKSKRALYDGRIAENGFNQKAATPNQEQAPRGANGFHDFVETAFTGKKTNKNASQGSTSHASHAAQKGKSAKPNTFWTMCQKCKMQYEYLRVYINHNLRCPNCHEPFFAMETPVPPRGPPSGSNDAKTSANSSRQQHSKVKTESGGFSNANGATDFQWAPFSRGGTSSAAHAASVVQQTYEKVKRERQEALAAKRREKTSKRKHHSAEHMSGNSSTDNFNSAKKRRGAEEVGSGSINQSEAIQINIAAKVNMLSRAEKNDILLKKAQSDIFKRMSQLKTGFKVNNVVPKDNFRKKVFNEEGRKNPDIIKKESQISADTQSIKTSGLLPSTTVIEHGRKTLESLSMSVLDSDFYDFDKSRTERAFEEGQVWAAYDDKDGMPRHYAIIQSVLSRDPFKVRISWLNSLSNTKLGSLTSLDWLGPGISSTCGDFRVGRCETNGSMNSFSHKVVWAKGAEGAIRIFPRKGDVWALYRNWSPDWDELTPGDIVHKYDLVEVLADYDEELGAIVIPLVKVAGFKTVFRQHLDRNQVRRISREEISQFSHLVPQHLLTSQDAPGTLKGCVELDPAATPPDLLNMIPVLEDEVGKHNEDAADREKEVPIKAIKQENPDLLNMVPVLKDEVGKHNEDATDREKEVPIKAIKQENPDLLNMIPVLKDEVGKHNEDAADREKEVPIKVIKQENPDSEI